MSDSEFIKRLEEYIDSFVVKQKIIEVIESRKERVLRILADSSFFDLMVIKAITKTGKLSVCDECGHIYSSNTGVKIKEGSGVQQQYCKKCKPEIKEQE